MSKNTISLKNFVQTYKSFVQKKNNNVYTFKVDPSLSKFQIKNFFEKNFNVKVEKICTSTKKPYSKNRKFTTKLEKKAFIKIKKGYSVESLRQSDKEIKKLIENQKNHEESNQSIENDKITSIEDKIVDSEIIKSHKEEISQ